MSRSKRIFLFTFGFGILLIGSIFLISKNGQKKELENNTVINMMDLSNEFVDKYLEEVNTLDEENKENILIVTSLEKIEDGYGASKIIEAPNNQYILQYDNEEKKEEALTNLKEDKDVINAEENIVYTISETSYNSWGVEAMALDYAMEVSFGKNLNDVTVAIIDTGCDMDLFNKYYDGKIAETYNVLESSTEIMTDENGHGTHIAGTIAESTPDNVKILPIKVSSGSSISNVDIIAAINYVTKYQKADVMNMSFGGYQYSSAMEDAIEAARQANIISVAAAGNDNTSASHFPAALDDTISIASIDSSLNKSTFSNHGSQIDFTAPGTNIKSIMSNEALISKNSGNKDGDNDHETISGTSMATPHAVSAIAILKSINKDLTLEDTIELLKTRTVDLGVPGWDKYYGYGLISFENVEFCGGSDCDEYNVFKENSKIVPTSIEVKWASRTTKNYGTVNNLNPTEVRIYDSTGSYTLTTLGELIDAEITGYDAYETDEQIITVKWQGLETTFNFTNPADWNSGWTYEVIDNNDIIITGFTDFNLNTKTTKLYIPEKIDGYNVVAIGNENSNVGVFHNATKTSYKEIILPSTLTEIKGTYTFSDFDSIEKITALSNSVKITGDYVFADNQSLIEFIGTIESLGRYTFDDNISLQKVTLSDNITELPDGAFFQCSNLENINIPSKLVTIGSRVFNNSFKLNNITLPEGLKTIGNYAFSYTNIENIVLPESLEQIGERAFANTNIRNLSISKNLTSIGENAFLGCSSLESIVVDEENPIYDSRENSNALIETETNTILKGIAYTTIPETITIIGNDAYSYDLRIEDIEIPENITEISSYAFYDCNYLTTITIPRSVTTIGDYALSIDPAIRQDNQQIPLTIYTYNDAYAKTYAAENEINYETMDYTAVIVRVSKREYKAFDKVNNTEDITSVRLQYNVGKTTNSSYSESRTFKDPLDGYEIKYINDNDSFRFGDTYYTVSGEDVYGQIFEKQVTVTVTKAIPEYTLPSGLVATAGQKLSEVELPDGFSWMNSDTIITGYGDVVFKAKFTPEDTNNYEVVEDIEITINVSKTEVTPSIVISDKTYDGTNTINLDSIKVSNLDNIDYTIESAVIFSSDVGNRQATIKIKISDDDYLIYAFDNNLQEKEFVVDMLIVPQKISKPTMVDKKYKYTGLEQTIELNNFDSEKLNISGNKRTIAGVQDVVISLNSSNYVWDDGTNDNIVFQFKIEKADLNIVDNSKDVTVEYDGLDHSIDVNLEYISGTTIRYMDESGEYTLESLPQYKNVGTYVIKYKLYIDENYNEYFGEKTLKIISCNIVNNSTDYKGLYDGKDHSINLDFSISDYTIKYSINNYNYDLEELPKFSEVGEYVVNYKVTCSSCNELTGSNKVVIYGVEEIDSTLILEDNVLLITNQNNSFMDISNKVKLFASSYSFIHYDQNNNVINGDVVGTGHKLVININDSEKIEYTISILGDVTGDGIVNIADVIKIADHTINKNVLVYEYEKIASDVTGDNIINIADVVKIADYTLDNSIKLWR